MDEPATRRDKVTKLGYGDGVILCDAQNMPKEAVLFELPFSACADSDYSISTYGHPIQILTRVISGIGDNRTVDAQSAAPRIILIEPTKTVEVDTKRITPDGVERKQRVLLTGCWWGVRPAGVQTVDNAYNLSFSPLPGSGEQILIDRYFKGLKRVLRRPRTLTMSICLNAEDIANLDLTLPIRLKKVRLGSLTISDNLFYLNQIKDYRTASTAQVVLIAI